MADWENRIEAKLDKVGSRLDSIDVTLTRQNLTLEAHTKRSDSLEAQVKPLLESYAEFKSGLNWLNWLFTCLMGMAALLEILRYLK